MPMPEEDDNISECFETHKDEKYTLDDQKIKRDFIDLVSKSLNIKSHAKNNLWGHIPQYKLFANKLSLFLREISFGEQKFFIDKFLPDLKYHHLHF